MCLFKVFARLSSSAEKSCWHPTFPRLFAFFSALIMASSLTMIYRSITEVENYPICSTKIDVTPKVAEFDCGSRGTEAISVQVHELEIVRVNDQVQYIDIIEGTGEMPEMGDTIVVRIPKSDDLPADYQMDDVEQERYVWGSEKQSAIQVEDVLNKMRMGGRRKIIINYRSDMTTEFEVELIGIEKPTKAYAGR